MPRGVYKRKEGVIYGNTGKVASDELRKKLSEAHKGQVAWNKGLVGVFVSPRKGIKTGKTISEQQKEKIRLATSGENNHKWAGGRPGCKSCDNKLSAYKSKTGLCIKCVGITRKGENSPTWIKDRTKLSKRQERSDMAYKEWRRTVWIRDGFRCKINNDDCNGRIEAHHILGWSSHPELRYETNNGITLCHAHHPRKRAEEKRLASRFIELVSVSNTTI